MKLFIIIFFIGLLSGCTNFVSKSYLPYPLTADDGESKAKVVTIPLPVIASSPNEGVTYGGMAAFLIHNREDEVHTLLTSQLTHNQYFGLTG